MRGADEDRPAHPRAVAMVVALAMFMGILDGTVIAVAMPHMASDFGVRPVDLSVGITAYLLVTAMVLPISSWVADRFGARRVFSLSIMGFAGASLLCGASNSLAAFVAARAVQAMFSSLMVPVGNLVLLRVTPKRDLVTVMAISTTPALIAPVIGPPLGGLITALVGWRWIFFINLPLALLGVFLVRRIIPQLRVQRPPALDRRGLMLTAGSLALLVFGFDRMAAHPDAWQAPLVVILIALAIGIGAIRHALTAPAPLVPLTALRHRSFVSVTFGAGFLARLPFMGQALLLPLYFQVGFGLSALATGVLLLAQNAGDLALKPVAGRVLARIGFRRALTIGALVMAIAFGACAALSPTMRFVSLFAALFAIGMARSIFFTAMMALSFADVPEDELAGATVLNNLGNAITAALGISLAALLYKLAGAWIGDAGGLAAYRIALLVLAGIGILAVPLFARLAADTGAEVSGHKPVGAAPAA